MKHLMTMNSSLKGNFVELLVQYKRSLLVLFCIMLVCGFFVYERIAPNGIFAGLQNDLKAIQPENNPVFYDLEGNPVDLATFKGKPLIINTWASWVPFSKDELGLLSRTKKKYGDTIEILAVNRMEPVATIRAYMEAFSIEKSLIFLTDPDDRFYKIVGGYAMPETIFYRKDGTIYAHVRGVLKEEEIEQYIQALQGA